MDDLDRLAFRLVRTIRQQYPQLRERGFTLTDLEERLLPHREARREMADGGADAWERTLLRLLSGERTYLQAPHELQQACRQALAAPSPALALVRTWSGEILALGEAAVRVGAERVSGAFEAARLAPEQVQQALSRTAPTAASTSTSMAAEGPTGPRLDGVTRGAVPGPGKSARRDGCACRFCGGRLPDERRATFCPHCGLDQTKRQCPACSTELETSWRFCVTCGRSADLPDAPAIVKRAAS
jgi:hypothetical protein